MKKTFPREATYPFENGEPAHWAPFRDWEMHAALTINEICALSFGMHPMLLNLANSSWSPYQISVWNNRRSQLIRAVHAGRIKIASSNTEEEITETTLVITVDALEYFGGIFETNIQAVKFPLKKKIVKQRKSDDRRQTKQAEALRTLAKHVLDTTGKKWTGFIKMLGDHSKELPFDGFGDCTNIYLKDNQIHFSLTQDDGKTIRVAISATTLKRYFKQPKQSE